MDIVLDYVYWGKIENIINNLGLDVLNIEYLEKVKINLSIKKENYKLIESIIINETSNNCLIKINGEKYGSVFVD